MKNISFQGNLLDPSKVTSKGHGSPSVDQSFLALNKKKEFHSITANSVVFVVFQ